MRKLLPWVALALTAVAVLSWLTRVAVFKFFTQGSDEFVLLLAQLTGMVEMLALAGAQAVLAVTLLLWAREGRRPEGG